MLTSFHAACALLCLTTWRLGVLQAFRHSVPTALYNLHADSNFLLGAKRNQLKGARKFTRRRPKKKTPARVYPTPTPYYGNIQEYFGAPREYYAVPVVESQEILREGAISRLVSEIRSGTTGTKLQEFIQQHNLQQPLLKELDKLAEIAKTQKCDVTSDLVLYFDKVIKFPTKNESFIDCFYTLDRIHTKWQRREATKYGCLFKLVFWRLRQMAFKLQKTGLALKDFNTPKMWHRFGVLKNLPKCSMAERYLIKHKVALEMDIKNLYFLDGKNKVLSIYDGRMVHDSPKYKPIKAIDQGVIDKIMRDLQNLSIVTKEQNVINCSRIDELQETYWTPEAQRAYAIRDFYLSHKLPNYTVVGDPFILESYINHDYRIKTLERDLEKRYQGWLDSGAMYKVPRPTGTKYQYLAKWHALPKAKKRQLAHEYALERAKSPF
ncbi:hypothetical protein BdWA1_000562 [Babesia duncani]|uniref:Uncharacterized protein n=1 Tax=Babesia duncani TaxID=323732 RepID=A0AAD9PHQ8_9APIC|nr:hypothetical protein BdWA1_003876 [Babesia duncani]KAK2197560.1 hypothetical protein BdWA1_000562 [Babesia duncani]